MFLCVLPLPFQFLAQKSVRCAGMLLGQIWSSGRVGERVKTEDLEALKQNTIVIVLIFISIATLMQCFSLTPGIPLLWSPPGFSLETSTGIGTGRVPLWFWIVGKWMRVGEIGSNLLVQLCGLPLKCGTDPIRRFVTKEQKESCWDGDGSCCSRQQLFCGELLTEVLWGWEVNATFIGDPSDTLAFECIILEIWV